MRIAYLALTLTVGTLCAPAAGAAGFQAYFEQSAAAMGQAAAVVARSGDPSAVFYNPAAICLASQSAAEGTLNGLVQQSSFNPATSAEALGMTAADLSERPVAIPALHLVHPVGQRCAVGLGVNTPYGAVTDWAPGWSGRYYADYTSLKSVYAAPTIAYRVSDRLAAGGGLLMAWGEATVEKAINAPLVYAAAAPDLASAFTAGAFDPANDVRARLRGDDWAWGGRLGLHWQATDRWAWGLTYQSAVRLEPTGRATYTFPTYDDTDFAGQPSSGATANQLAAALFPDTDIRTRITLPATLTGGTAFAPHPRLTLEVDVTWTDWSSYDSLNITYGSLTGATDVTVTAPKHWEDTVTLRLGAEYAHGEHLIYRAGYAYDQSPIPNATRDPSLPGADRHDLTLGLAYRLHGWTLDAAYLHALIAGAPSEQRSSLNGDLSGGYDATAHLFAFGISHHF